MLSGRVAGLTIILGLHASSSRDTFGLSLEDRQANREDSHFATVRARGKELLAKGDTRGAQSLYEATVKQAAAMSDWAAASRFVNNIAGCQMARFEYREAVNSFLESRRMALQARDTEVVFATSMNLSAIYLQLGDVKLAAEAVARGLAADGGQPRPELRAAYLSQIGGISSRQGQFERAIRYYSDGVDAASAAGDRSTEAKLWSNIGVAYLGLGDLDRAESAIYEGYRIRVLSKDPTAVVSYPAIGRILVARGKPEQALIWLDKALANAARLQLTDPPWLSHYRRSMALSALGREKEAHEGAMAAMESMKLWRLGVVPSDRLRVASQEGARQVFDAVISTAGRLYLSTRGAKYAWRGFQAAEDSRAWSLRESLRQSEAGDALPPEYHRALAQLRTELAGRGRGNPGLSLRLAELESRAGIDRGTPAKPLALSDLRTKLKDGETLFSFHLDEPVSWLWTVTKSQFRMTQLPGRVKLSRLTADFRRTVERDGPDMETVGKALSSALFKDAPEPARRNPHWRLALDQDLFGIPFAALPEMGGSGYTVEHHSIQATPNVLLWLESAPRGRPGRTMLAIADPIYNAADPRLARPWWALSSGLARRNELPRLAGGAEEVRSCAAAFGKAGATILTGASADGDSVRRALSADPAVVHFAAHVTPLPMRPGQGAIALSLGPEGGPDLLGETEIGAMRIHSGLVVMNGCSSGAGAVLPAAGLLGLTRAWLRAGARNVAAARWPVPDDSGELFRNLYRHLAPEVAGGDGRTTEQGASLVPAGSLWSSIAMQKAQRECIRSGGWRAKPSYWAAYFTVGRD